MPVFLIILGVVAMILLMVFSVMAERKRRERFAAYAAERGWSYTHEKDHQFDDAFRSLPFVGPGTNRYLHHRMQGRLGDQQLWIGEYHYQVTRRTGKRTSTQHYYSTLVMLRPPFGLRDLSIRREGLFDRVKAAFGWDDIDFASAEFSRTFYVSSPDRNWAFAFIQPKTMDLLLRTHGIEFHLRKGWLILRTNRNLKLEALPELIRTGEALLAEVPDFVREGAS